MENVEEKITGKMVVHRRVNLKNELLLISGFLMPSQILAYKIIPFFVIPLLLFYVIKITNREKIVLNFFGSLYFCLTILMMFVVFAGILPSGWKVSARNQLVLYLIVLFFAFLNINKIEVDCLLQGVKSGIKANIIWAVIQLVFKTINNTDINNLVFNQMLKIREEASTVSFDYGLNITGLNWHPAQLVPIIILGYFLFDDLRIKFAMIVLAFVSNNSTCIIAVALCLMMDYIFVKKKGISKKTPILILVILILIAVVVKSDFIVLFVDKIKLLMSRIISLRTKTQISNSTLLHFRYYVSYPLICERIGILGVLFGIGFECSGYPFSVIYGQYASMKSWHVESDLINYLIGRGVIYTIIYYVMMLYIAIKGKKICIKYVPVILAFAMCGIFYNNQFLWVELFMLIMVKSVKKGIDIFNSGEFDYIESK